MAGTGPAPKDPSKRARRNADPIPTRVIQFVPGEQPELPAEIEWHPQTHRWWAMWGESEQAKAFTATDWDFLLDTARLHTMYWNGAVAVGAELRLRVAKFGATPEDRARLRISFADADKKDGERTSSTPPQASKNYGSLKLMKSGEQSS